MQIEHPITRIELNKEEVVELIACLRVARHVASSESQFYSIFTSEFGGGFERGKVNTVMEFTDKFFKSIKYGYCNPLVK